MVSSDATCGFSGEGSLLGGCTWGVVGRLHPRVRGASRSDERGTATAKLKLPWSGGCLGGQSNAEDG